MTKFRSKYCKLCSKQLKKPFSFWVVKQCEWEFDEPCGTPVSDQPVYDWECDPRTMDCPAGQYGESTEPEKIPETPEVEALRSPRKLLRNNFTDLSETSEPSKSCKNGILKIQNQKFTKVKKNENFQKSKISRKKNSKNQKYLKIKNFQKSRISKVSPVKKLFAMVKFWPSGPMTP